MMLRLRTLRKRLERLEAGANSRMNTAGRSALVKMSLDFSDSPRHLEVVYQAQGHYTFQEAPGPGPKLEDFGEFDSVIWLTPFESGT